jgi:hypothetical protein
MFRFRNVDVSRLGPFDSDQLLCIPDGLTLVAGRNGTGKTTIAEALRREYYGAKRTTSESRDQEVPSWLIFFNDSVQMPYAGAHCAPLASLMSCRREFFTRRRDIESDLTKNIRLLLRDKIEGRVSKFSTRVTSPEQMLVTLIDDGAVVVATESGEQIIDCFQAIGEKLALYLSINATVRNLLCLDIPFVVDSQLCQLDKALLSVCYHFVAEVSKQSIVLESNFVVDALGVEPRIRIAQDPITGISTIEKVAPQAQEYCGSTCI